MSAIESPTLDIDTTPRTVDEVRALHGAAVSFRLRQAPKGAHWVLRTNAPPFVAEEVLVTPAQLRACPTEQTRVEFAAARLDEGARRLLRKWAARQIVVTDFVVVRPHATHWEFVSLHGQAIEDATSVMKATAGTFVIRLPHGDVMAARDDTRQYLNDSPRVPAPPESTKRLREPRPMVKVTPEIVARMIELLQAGKWHHQIAAEVGVSKSTVQRVLKAHGHVRAGGNSLKDISGQRFGMLIPREIVGRSSSGCAIWKCDCDCGGTAHVETSNLTGGTKSCGCLRGRPQQREVAA